MSNIILLGNGLLTLGGTLFSGTGVLPKVLARRIGGVKLQFIRFEYVSPRLGTQNMNLGVYRTEKRPGTHGYCGNDAVFYLNTM
jgi:hypothetical protein